MRDDSLLQLLVPFCSGVAHMRQDCVNVSMNFHHSCVTHSNIDRSQRMHRYDRTHIIPHFQSRQHTPTRVELLC